MDILGPLFFILFIIGAIAIGIAVASHQANALNETYGRLAKRFGGHLHEGGWLRRPSVTFHHQSNWVRVDIYSTGGKNPTYYTQVHLGWPEPGFRCEVYPEGFFHRIGKFLGMQDVEIGSPAFDRAYVITGSDVSRLRELLSVEVQLLIDRLRTVGDHGGIYVAVRNYELLVKKQGMIRDADTLISLTQLALDLHDAALVPANQGIQFVDGPPQASPDGTIDSPICQICGEAIVSDLVYCRGCETPHHHDCWNYYGQCSTFGCGKRKYYRPRKKKSK